MVLLCKDEARGSMVFSVYVKDFSPLNTMLGSRDFLAESFYKALFS
jgi:hypothetical protein